MAELGMESDMLAVCAKYLDKNNCTGALVIGNRDLQSYKLNETEIRALEKFQSALAVLALLRARAYMKVLNMDGKAQKMRHSRFNIDMQLEPGRFKTIKKGDKISDIEIKRRKEAEKINNTINNFAKANSIPLGKFNRIIPVALQDSDLDCPDNGNDFDLTVLTNIINDILVLPCR